MDLDEIPAIVEELRAKPMGITVMQAAEGILEVVNANTPRAFKLISVQKGYDPHEFALACYGAPFERDVTLGPVSVARTGNVYGVAIDPTDGRRQGYRSPACGTQIIGLHDKIPPDLYRSDGVLF